jgi:predicted alpha/beta superfamily hydrolase
MKEILDDYNITITPSLEPTDVIVYCNSYGDGTEPILKSCEELDCLPFYLVVISKIHWDADMSPYPADKVISKHDNFAGNADKYLEWMLTSLIPHCEKLLKVDNPCRILLGYSMSGLFSLYAMYRTDKFAAYISASGSLWYPNFEDFVISHEPMTKATVYLSIGDKECISKNAYLQTIIEKTQHIFEHYKVQGHVTHFELNPGNHFVDGDLRQAKGIKWAIAALGKESDMKLHHGA